ncbi:hypothetical protein Bcep1808_5767 [Burkholderia vietnamiensis G4]|uniref:Uncharacterized protein n=1 Tax=Burkholderia vietnamiensis (strain G4 / LMG 22486) TaxID=269482 RepID=A4JQZ6_BURVG|nr:hypothetical protein Bcep1808_5767 [Burkholderia vietnamiensis G4]
MDRCVDGDRQSERRTAGKTDATRYGWAWQSAHVVGAIESQRVPVAAVWPADDCQRLRGIFHATRHRTDVTSGASRRHRNSDAPAKSSASSAIRQNAFTDGPSDWTRARLACIKSTGDACPVA